MTTCTHDHTATRRSLLRGGLAAGAGLAAPPLMFAPAAIAQKAQGSDGRILVVLELSGGNDGLNTVVPYADDAYYRLRPEIGIKAQRLRKIDDHFGLNPGMVGMEKLYKDGQLAIAAVTTTLPSRTSPRWPTGTRPHQTAASRLAGSAGSQMRWLLKRRQTS